MKSFITKINYQAAYAVMIGGATGLVVLVAWATYEEAQRIKREKTIRRAQKVIFQHLSGAKGL